MKNFKTQVSQLVNTVGILKAQASGKLPPQTVINPKENASAISLRRVNNLMRGPLKPKKPRRNQNSRRIFRMKKIRPLLQLKVGDYQRRFPRIQLHLLFGNYHSLASLPSPKRKKLKRRFGYFSKSPSQHPSS